MTTTETNRIDEARLEAFVGQAVTDMGAAISGLLLHIGDRLGLYQAMAGAGPVTAPALAARTGTAERYVREWLGNQAAGGYVVYDPVDGTFELPAEHAMVVADEDSPVFLAGAFEAIASLAYRTVPGQHRVGGKSLRAFSRRAVAYAFGRSCS